MTAFASLLTERQAALSGLFVPHLTPFDDAGAVDTVALAALVEWLIQKGVDGLYPNGSTGEFVRLGFEERCEVARVVAETTAGRVPILLGATEANLADTLRVAELGIALGVRALAVMPPYYYKLTAGSIYTHFATLARETPLDILLYNIPLFSNPLDYDTTVRLALEFPRIIGIKDSSGDWPHMVRLISAIRPTRPTFSFLTGWDASLVPMLLAGCDGGTNATTGVAPEFMRRLYTLTQKGMWREAMELQAKLIELFDLLFAGGEFPDGFRAAAAARGLRVGRGRQSSDTNRPLPVDRIARKLADLLALVDSPLDHQVPSVGSH